MVRNINTEGRVRDHHSFETGGDSDSAERANKNQQRRRILHLVSVFNTRIRVRSLIAIFSVADETTEAGISAAGHGDISRAGDDDAIDNFRRIVRIENRCI